MRDAAVRAVRQRWSVVDGRVARRVPDPPVCLAGAVALTFDDGPGRYTTAVLDILAARDAAGRVVPTG